MNKEFIDLSGFRMSPEFRGRSSFTVQLWWLVQDWLFKTSPQFMYGWRRFLLRIFGAEIGNNVLIRPSVRITYPWKVKISDNSWVGDNAEFYSLGQIEIGENTVISQQVYLCAGTHDYGKLDFPLIEKKIKVDDQVWICAGSFVAPGVSIGKGVIVGARSVVLKDLEKEKIYAGNPAVFVKDR